MWPIWSRVVRSSPLPAASVKKKALQAESEAGSIFSSGTVLSTPARLEEINRSNAKEVDELMQKLDVLSSLVASQDLLVADQVESPSDFARYG